MGGGTCLCWKDWKCEPNCHSRCVYQGEALGWGGPSLDGCQRPLLHHVLRLLVHTHHRLFGYPQQPRDQLVFPLHLFLPDEEASHRVYASAKHLHRWFIQGAWAENAGTGVIARAVFMEDSAPCGGGGKVAAVRWPSRVQAGVIAGLLNGSSLGFRRCQCADTMLPLPPPNSSALHFAHWESITVHFRDWAYTWLSSRGAKDHAEISDLERWGRSKYACFLPLGYYYLEKLHNKTL